MTEGRKTWTRLAVLAAVVLALHLWLLGGWRNVIAPAQRAAPFNARTVEAPAPPPQEQVAQQQPTPAQPATPKPERKVAPPPPAPRKQEPPRTQEPSAKAREVETAKVSPPAAAPAPPSAEAAATHAAGAAPARSFAVAPSARYHYDVTAQSKGFTLKGTALLEWRNENGEYSARMDMSSPLPFVKPRVQQSKGLVTSHGLEPVRFSDKIRAEEAAHFDREQGKVTFSTNKPEAALEPGAQDRLSIVMQLGAMLGGAPAKFPAGSQITVQTASTKEAEPWTFTVEGKETLDLPGGRVAAVRLTRNPRKDYDVKVELWLAPGHAYAPVRLRLTQPNGDWVDQQWSSTDRG